MFHVPVMPGEVIENLIKDRDGTYVDGTLGGGGHAALILKNLSNRGRLIGLDRDRDAVGFCREKFAGERRMSIHNTLFSSMDAICAGHKLSGVLLDLGVSSHQLNSPDRGFSFESGLPFDMRMDRESGRTALDYLDTTCDKDLARALSRNADLKKARSLARALKKSSGSCRDTSLIHRALDQVYPRGLRNRPGLLARICQAIRMEVNHELDDIKLGLESAIQNMKPKARLCVLTYHSAEDRTVKQVLVQHEKSCVCPPAAPVCMCGGRNRKIKKVHKKPLLPSLEERQRNRRSRSAKLRVVEKTETYSPNRT
ncbi:16S rRNA (cytosine(1402)-N(4))-methyltransferase RsmH [Fibrobacterota bacterium]